MRKRSKIFQIFRRAGGRGARFASGAAVALCYLLCIGTAGLVVAGCTYKLSEAWAGVLAQRLPMVSQKSEKREAKAGTRDRVPEVVVQRAAHMSLTAERINGDPEFWGRYRRDRRVSNPKAAHHSEIRVSQRYRMRRDFDDDDDDDIPRPPAVTYRTVCVRLCDGYYFPISFTTTRNRFTADAAQCQNRCGSEARLFVYRNPGGTPETMEDLQGRPYAQLPNAFLHRSQYVANCKCRPDPWDAAAKEQHRIYALAAQAKSGNKAAQAELKSLAAVKRADDAKPTVLNEPTNIALNGNLPRQQAEFEGERRMGLGRARPTPQHAAPAQGFPSWARKAFHME